MALIESTVVVNAPVSQVFRFVTDPQRHPEWVPGVVSVEVTPGTAGRIGERWTMVYSSMGMRSKSYATIVELEEDQRVVWEIGGDVMDAREVQRYEAAGASATRFSLRNEFRLKGFMGILGPLMTPMIRRNFQRGDANMKRICEAEVTKQGSP